MAEENAPISTLVLDLTAKSDEAVKAVTSVITALQALRDDSKKPISTTRLTKFFDGLDGITDIGVKLDSAADAMDKFIHRIGQIDDSKIGSIQKLARAFDRIGKSAGTSTEAFKNLAGGVNEAVKSLSALSKTDDYNAFDKLTEAIGKLKGLGSIGKLGREAGENLTQFFRVISQEASSLKEKDIVALERYTAAMEKIKGMRITSFVRAKEQARKEFVGTFDSFDEYFDAAQKLHPEWNAIKEANDDIKKLTSGMAAATDTADGLAKSVRKIQFFDSSSVKGKHGAAYTWLDDDYKHGKYLQFDELTEFGKQVGQEIRDGIISGVETVASVVRHIEFFSSKEVQGKLGAAYTWLGDDYQHGRYLQFDELKDFGKQVRQELEDGIISDIVKTRLYGKPPETGLSVRPDMGMRPIIKPVDEKGMAAMEKTVSGITEQFTMASHKYEDASLLYSIHTRNASEATRSAMVAMSAFAQEFDRTLRGIGAVIDEIGEKIQKVGAWLSRFYKIRPPKFIREILGTLGPFVQAIGTATSGVGELISKFGTLGERIEKTRKLAGELGEAMRTMSGSTILGDLVSSFVTFGSVFKTVLSFGGTILKTIAGITGRVIQGVLTAASVITSVIGSIIHVITGIIGTVVNIIGSILGTVVKIVSGIISAIIGVIRSAIGLIVNAVKGIVSAVISVIQSVVSFVAKAVGAIVSKVASAVSRIVQSLGEIGIAAGKAFIQLAVSPFTSFIDDIKSVISWLKNLQKRFIRMASMRIFRTAVNSLGKALKEGMENLYEFGKATKSVATATQFVKSMNSYATSMLYLKDSVAAAVAPVVNALIPALQTATRAVVEMLNAINQLFSALSGKNFFVKATEYATRYETAASKASGAQHDLLADWDELNVIQSTSSGSGSGSNLDYSKLFEEAAVSNPIKEFAAQIKEFMNSDDWGAIGKLFADKVNGFIDSVDWPEWGGKLGRQIRRAIDTVHGFITNIDGSKIGSALAGFLSSAIGEINATHLGEILGAKITVLFDAAVEFLRKGNENGLWSKLGGFIHDTILGTVRKINDWFSENDMTTIREDIKTAVINLLSGLKADEIGAEFWKLIGNAVRGSVSVISGALGGIWDYVWNGAAVPSGDTTVYDSKKASTGFKGLKSVFQPYIDGAGGDILQGILDAFKKNGSQWATNIFQELYNVFLKPIDDELQETFGVRPFEAFGAGINSFLKPWVNAAKKLFASIIEPTVELPDGIDAISGADAKAGQGGKSFKEVWSELVKWYEGPFATALEGAAETIGHEIRDFMADPADWVCQKWDDFQTWLGREFKAGVKSAFEEVCALIDDLLGWEKGTASSKARAGWEDFKTWFNDDKEGFPKFKDTLLEFGRSVWTNLQNPTTIISQCWSAFADWFNTTFGVDLTKILEDFKTNYITPNLEDPVDSVEKAWAALSGWFDLNVKQPLIDQLNAIASSIADCISGITNLMGMKVEWNPETMSFSSRESTYDEKNDNAVSAFTNAVQDYGSNFGADTGMVEQGVNLLKNLYNKVTGNSSTTSAANGTASSKSGTSSGTTTKTSTTTNNTVSTKTSTSTSSVATTAKKAVQDQVNVGKTIVDGVKTAVKNVTNVVSNVWSALTGGSKKTTTTVTKKASGDYSIPTGEMYIARENGSELIGRIGSHNSVVNNDQIIDGIAAGVRSANEEEVRLLRQQNELLQRLLAKESKLVLAPSAQLGRVNAKSARMYEQTTGRR